MIGLVYINRGRWLVDCPREECGWAYRAMSPAGLPRYLHTCCGDNTGPGCGLPIELVWPALDEAEQIVETLALRNLLATRNWLPNETVDALMRENDGYLVNRDLAWLAENELGGVK